MIAREPQNRALPETGPFVLVNDAVIDAERRMVLKDGRLTPLEPRVWEVLEYFLANRDRVISRDELIQKVWKGVHVVDEAVMRTISVLRDAFGDDPKQPRFIETSTKRGYRFIGAVVSNEPRAESSFTGRRRWIAAGVIAAVFAGGMTAGMVIRPKPAAPPPIRMINLDTGEVRTLPQP